jgi:mannose-6-phosphate isomerase-like protein (cupin superfamily)
MADGMRINLAEKLGKLSDHWKPRLVDTVDDYEIKIVKVEGDFVWHKHDDADELFIVLKGELRMDFRDRQVAIGPGEIIVVPKGVEHKPFAARECEMMLLEKRGVVNTGDATPNAYTRSTEVERI